MINETPERIVFRYERTIDSQLVAAILISDTKGVEKAISSGANVDAEEISAAGRSPIHFAALQTNNKIIDILARNKAKLHKIPPAQDDTENILERHALFIAFAYENDIAAKALLSHMSDLESQPWFDRIPQEHINRIADLRARTTDPKPYIYDPSKMLYRFKTTFTATIFGVLTNTLIGINCFKLTLASSILFSTTATALCTFLITSLEIAKNHFINTDDVRQGIDLACSKGIKETISLILNAPKYEDLDKSRTYSFRLLEIEDIGYIAK